MVAASDGRYGTRAAPSHLAARRILLINSLVKRSLRDACRFSPSTSLAQYAKRHPAEETSDMRTMGIIAIFALLCSANAVHAADSSCESSDGVDFICGIQNAEDLVMVPARGGSSRAAWRTARACR